MYVQIKTEQFQCEVTRKFQNKDTKMSVESQKFSITEFPAGKIQKWENMYRKT